MSTLKAIGSVVLIVAGCSAAPDGSSPPPGFSPAGHLPGATSDSTVPSSLMTPMPTVESAPSGTAPVGTAATPGVTSPSEPPAASPVPVPGTPVPPPPTTPAPAPIGWTAPEEVSTRYYEGYDLLIDNEGIAHAAAELDDAVWYLTNAAGSWTRERLSTPPGSGGHDGAVQIAMDRDGTLAVAFIRFERWRCELDCYGRPEATYILSNAGGEWSEPEPVPVDRRPYHAGIAIHDGRIHVLASVRDDAAWYGTRLDGGAWTAEHLPGRARNAQLALASDGTARVLYLHETLRFATAAGQDGGFTVEDVPVDAGPALLALDRADRPHIVMDEHDGAGARYLTRDDSGWSAPVPAFPGLTISDDCGEIIYEGMGASGMAVSDDGAVHVLSPNEVLFAGLWYASNRTGTFDIQQVQPRDEIFDEGELCLEDIAVDGDPTRPAAIDVDDTGRPHVLYQSVDGLKLVYQVGAGD